MNHMTIDSPDAPWNENLDHLFICDACNKTLNKYEEGDPCVIEGRTLCDRCASDLTALRWDGVLPMVSDRTNKLVHEYNKALYYRVYDNVNFPKS